MAKSRSKKTRKPARSTARSSAKRKGTKKTAKRARTSRVRVATPARAVLDVKKFRADLERAVAVLGKRGTRDADGQLVPHPEQERLTRWIAEADEFCGRGGCGPTMEIPLES